MTVALTVGLAFGELSFTVICVVTLPPSAMEPSAHSTVLEEPAFTTALAIWADIGTAPTITPVHLASDLRGNVPAPERLDTRSNPFRPSSPLSNCLGPR